MVLEVWVAFDRKLVVLCGVSRKLVVWYRQLASFNGVAEAPSQVPVVDDGAHPELGQHAGQHEELARGMR